MTLADFIQLAMKVSLLAIVCTLGLRARASDIVYLFERPGLLVRSIVAMNIVMLAFAVFVSYVFPLPLAVKIALVTLALSPVPPILPRKQAKAGGTQSYAIGLLVAASIISIALIPLSLMIVGAVFQADYSVAMNRLLTIVLVSIVAPLCVGLLIRLVAPAFAEKVAGPVAMLAMALLVLAALPIAFSTGTVVWQLVGDGVIIFLLLFTVIGLAVGHFFGGPIEDDRTVLALATATRHPGIAIALVSINFPEEKAALAVILWHLLFGIIIAIPYVRWRKRMHADMGEPR